MSQEITVTKVEDHYEMQFGGGDAYPVPTNAIDKLDDDLTPKEVGESVTFEGDYGGHKHAKTFDVEEVIETLGDDEEGTDETEDSDEDSAMEGVDVDDLEVGDRVSNSSQRSGNTFEVVDIREEQTFSGSESVFVVRRVGRNDELMGLEGDGEVIYEKDHCNWEVVEA